jgi:hypothetical protein
VTGDVKWNDDTTLELWRRYQIYATELLEPGVTGISHDAGPPGSLLAMWRSCPPAFGRVLLWKPPRRNSIGRMFLPGQ